MTTYTLSFKEGYEVLKRNAELLESQQEPDIDNLMKIGGKARKLFIKIKSIFFHCAAIM